LRGRRRLPTRGSSDLGGGVHLKSAGAARGDDLRVLVGEDASDVRRNDLADLPADDLRGGTAQPPGHGGIGEQDLTRRGAEENARSEGTRLNSSHVKIS